MDFPREELLEKYARLREQVVEPYKPDFDTREDMLRYVSIMNMMDLFWHMHGVSKILKSILCKCR